MPDPTARSLILDLASTADGRALPVRGLVRIAEVFGIGENNVRVALARLLSKGLLQRDERGEYRLAPEGRAVQRHVASWTDVGSRKIAWKGDWVAVHTGGPRPSRTAVRRRKRALGFLGFRELRPHLWIRPDNLRGGVDAVRERATELGLEASTPVFGLHGLDAETQRAALGLWTPRSCASATAASSPPSAAAAAT